MEPIGKLRRLVLRYLAHAILEPRLKTKHLSAKGRNVVKDFRDRLKAVAADAFRICDATGACRTCKDSRCCSGRFSRITAVDSVLNEDRPEWGYVLYPFGSYSRNRCDEGWCEFFSDGKGCELPADKRPAACISYLCSDLEAALDAEASKEMKALSRAIDSIQLGVVWRLCFAPGIWERR